MKTNFTLNKKMKEKLVYDLTAKAVEKQLKALENKLIVLNSEFWAKHDDIVAGVLQIDTSRYNELVQAGALLCTTVLTAKGLENSKDSIGERLFNLGREINMRLQGHISKFIGRNGNYFSHLQVKFVNNFSVPTVSRETLNLASSGACPFSVKADKLLGDYIGILKYAQKFHSDAQQIIMPLRSYRVLLEQFPEAAKLLTPPTKPVGNMIPAELISSVRDRLCAGIPEAKGVAK